ncbi:MAG: PDZ domain-containing protein [Phycisphaerales bacterium]
MQILSTLSKQAIVATLIAATGLPASMANAQFKVEYNEKTKPAQADEKADKKVKETKEEHVFVIRSNDDDHEYEVKVINGIVKYAEVDGKEIDHDRIKLEDDVVVFLSENGKVLTEFKVPGIAQWSKGEKATLSWTTKSPTVPDAPKPTNIRVANLASQPKVMLGINLTEPSDAVRKQLKLGDDQQAIFVEKVIDGLPAKKAGLEAYDVIVSIDGSEYANGELLRKVLREKSPGDPLKLVVLRGGDTVKIKAELAPYSAEKLGVASFPGAEIEISDDFEFPKVWQGQDEGFTFDLNFGPELHEKIHKALRESGISEEQLGIVEEQLHEHLGGLNNFFTDDSGKNRFFFSPEAPDEHEHDRLHEHEEHIAQAERQHREALRQRELAVVAQEKARAAMRDAQRQVMELRDGRLFVREAEEMGDHLAELETRLTDLENRLERQMNRMEEQMDRMADLFERLIDRMERDDH